MKKILISNIYGKHNLGDHAIRNSALNVFSQTFSGHKLYLLNEELENFSIETSLPFSAEYSPYGYAIRSDSTQAKPLIIKLLRYAAIVSKTLYYVSLSPKKRLPKNGFYRYIRWIQECDVFILMGGGYLVTKRRFSDYFGLSLNALPIILAKIFHKKIVVLPISFGPFASRDQEAFIGNILSGTDLMLRDHRSLAIVKPYNTDAYFVPDLALYDWKEKSSEQREKYFVLSVKDYLSQEEQQKVEEELIHVIGYVWKTYGYSCVFVPTGANPIEENDLPVGRRLEKKLPKEQFSIVLPKTPNQAKQIIRKAKFSICTRMHAAIFSALTYTPFLALAYEHKVQGFMEILELEQWCMEFKTLHHISVIKKINLLLQKEKQHAEQLIKKRKEILDYKASLIQQVHNYLI